MLIREEVIREIINDELKKWRLAVWASMIQDDWIKDGVLWYSQRKYRFHLWSMWYVMHFDYGYNYDDLRKAFNRPLSVINHGMETITNVIRKPKQHEEQYQIYTTIKEILS